MEMASENPNSRRYFLRHALWGVFLALLLVNTLLFRTRRVLDDRIDNLQRLIEQIEAVDTYPSLAGERS